ncbi:hypothetical protein Agub_g11992, partial [Astrephomene gubernaculifera]
MDFVRADAVEAFLHMNIYRELKATGTCGATVVLKKVGRYPFTLANCYGFQDASRGLVLDPRISLIDLGSCAKLLAAMALLKLLQENGLTVAADVNSLLPSGIAVDTSRYGSVTLQHLLTHTSGLQRGRNAAAPAAAAAAGSGGSSGSGAGDEAEAPAGPGGEPPAPGALLLSPRAAAEAAEAADRT